MKIAPVADVKARFSAYLKESEEGPVIVTRMREATKLKDSKFIPSRKGLLKIFKTLSSVPISPEELAELKRHFPTPCDAVSPIVRRKDEKKHGEYRTKRVILEIYDEMAEAMRSGTPYKTRLDPPPADPRCCHPAKEVKTP